MSEALEARVNARNRANYLANEWYGKIAEAFAPLCGKKIKLQDGGFTVTAKAVIAKLDLPYGDAVKMRMRCDQYRLWCEITCRETVAGERPDGYGFNETERVYIGKLDSCVLREPLEAPITNRRTDYMVAEIVEKRRVVNELQEMARKAISDLSPFGEYDH